MELEIDSAVDWWELSPDGMEFLICI